jgi:hypothetical protein
MMDDSQKTTTIYVSVEAKKALKAVQTKMPEYKLASDLILSGIAQRE